MRRLILESKLTSHQKLHVLLSLGGPVLIVIYKITTLESYFKTNALLVLFILVFIGIVCSVFLKKGVLKVGKTLYKGTFLFNKLLVKKKVDLSDKPKVSILKFKRNQKMAWFSIASPDASLIYLKSDVTLLNEKHTEKEVLISLDNEENANQVVSFLAEHFHMKNEIYSPDFS